MNKLDKDTYLTTREVKETLKVSDCSIMHLRTGGKIKFKKRGNAYLYFKEDVKKLADRKSRKEE